VEIIDTLEDWKIGRLEDWKGDDLASRDPGQVASYPQQGAGSTSSRILTPIGPHPGPAAPPSLPTFTTLRAGSSNLPTFHSSNHPGLAYRENGAVTITPDRPFIKNLDDLPLPLHTCCHGTSTGRRDSGPYTFVVPSRGCPAGCQFCIKHVSYGRRCGCGRRRTCWPSCR